MAFALSDLRTDIDNELGSVIDASTWTLAIKDEAVRQALQEYIQKAPPLETTTTTNASSLIDLSSLTPACYRLLAVSWPWSGYAAFFDRYLRSFRFTDTQIVALNGVVPGAAVAVGIRYLRAHTISSLDSAATTTPPDTHRRCLAKGAAAHACKIRIRQISENPAIPKDAKEDLQMVFDGYYNEFQTALNNLVNLENPTWSRIGL